METSHILIIAFVLLVFFGGPLWNILRGKDASPENSDMIIGVVTEIHQTGSTLNNVPYMHVEARIEQSGEAAKTVTFRQLIDLGNMPRVGEKIYLARRIHDPQLVTYLGLASSVESQLTQVGNDRFQMIDALAISPVLRESRKYGVGVIKSIESTEIPNVFRFQIEIDSCVAPKRLVTIEQVMRENPFVAGDRTYLFVTDSNPNAIAIVPLSFVGNKKINPSFNRLDSIVLGPQILHYGKKAMGTVTKANAESMPNRESFMAKQGAERWHLEFDVKPEDGSASYHTQQTLTFTDAERVKRICHEGAVVPLRLDWNDPMTVVTDPLAWGYPDPYEKLKDMYQTALARGDVKPDA